MKAIWSSLNDGNFHEVDWALRRHNGFLDTFAPLTFVGNHDVTRIASKLADPEHLGHALVTLFTVGGVPTIHAGDELGYCGVKEDRAGGDDAVRPEFGAPPRHRRGRPRLAEPASPSDRVAPSASVAARGPDRDSSPGQSGLRLPQPLRRALIVALNIDDSRCRCR